MEGVFSSKETGDGKRGRREGGEENKTKSLEFFVVYTESA